MKVGLLSFPIHASHGCLLQMYALKTTLEKLGHEVVLIDRRFPIPNYPRFVLLIIKRLIKIILGRRVDGIFYRSYVHPHIMRPFSSFIDKFLSPRTKSYYNSRGLRYLSSEDFDAYVTGSDQIWRPEYVPNIYDYFFQFLGDRKVKRISYAASFGVDNWLFDEEQTLKCKWLATKFSSISVREESGILLCRNYLDADAVCVLDPTLLLTADDYLRIIDNSNIRKKQIACYILDKSSEITDEIRCLSKKINMPYLNVLTQTDNSTVSLKEKIPNSIEFWLDNLANSEYIVVDSFHAMVFSILFKKQFVVFMNQNRGCARFESLLKKLGLENRIVRKNTSLIDVLNVPVDWDIVDSRLDKLRRESVDFLIKSLTVVS